MTREDVQELMAMVMAVFQNFKPANRTVTVNAWDSFLQEYPKEKVFKAFKIFCISDTSGFPPTPAQIIKILQEMDGEISELDAWSMVRKATCNGIYHSQEEFDKLPEVIKAAVGSADNIREWAMRDSSEVESVIMSHFLRAYRTAQERMRRADVFPEFNSMIEQKESVELIEEKEERECIKAPKCVIDAMEKLEKGGFS